MGIFDVFGKKGNDLAKMQQALKSKENQIKELEKIVVSKDKNLDKVMADALRHGSPLGGKQMAESFRW